LRTLLRKGGEGFGTPTAMNLLDLEEPEITRTLSALQQSGWIEYVGRRDGIDRWQPSRQGDRLSATALLKRIPRARGQQILAEVVQEVRAINADLTHSIRFKEILLFGSLLNGTPDDTIGDIDLVVEDSWRLLPEKELARLRERESADAPATVRNDVGARVSWPQTRLLRRLRRISPYISLHQTTDLPGNLYQQVYAYDLEHECEVPADTELKLFPGDPHSDRAVVANTAYTRPERDWPVAPKGAAIEHLDAADARVAQHLWMNGMSTEEIATKVRMQPRVILAYLASRSTRNLEKRQPTIHASLKATLLQAVTHPRNYSSTVWIRRYGQNTTITVEVLGPRQRRAYSRRENNECNVSQSPPEYLPTLEALDRTARAWYETMQPLFRRLSFEIHADLDANESAEAGSESDQRIDPRPLAQPLRDLLREYCTQDERAPGWLSVTIEANPVLSFEAYDGVYQPPQSESGNKSRIIELARRIYETSRPAFAKGISLRVFVGDVE